MTETKHDDRQELKKAGWTVAECSCCWVPPGGLDEGEAGYDSDEALLAKRAKE